MSNKEKYLGKILETKSFGKYKVIEYLAWDNITVKFLQTGYVTKTRQQHITDGVIKDYLYPSVYGVGYYGSPSANTTGRAAFIWRSVMQRCYEEEGRIEPAYYEVNVCTSWHNFLVFEEWVVKQPGFDTKGWELDKDLLIKGNKLYSPDTCVYLPKAVNAALTKRHNHRGKYPIGVQPSKSGKRFEAWCGDGERSRYLGVFGTPIEAFLCYKAKKEEMLRSLAEKYKDELDPRAYQALMNYQVEITD
jgi:hypothetical protein